MRSLLATGCCFDARTDDGTCVELGRCWEWQFQEELCAWEHEPPLELSTDHRVCTGVRHEDRRCADLGYTVPCERGTYFVPPGSGC